MHDSKPFEKFFFIIRTMTSIEINVISIESSLVYIRLAFTDTRYFGIHISKAHQLWCLDNNGFISHSISLAFLCPLFFSYQKILFFHLITRLRALSVAPTVKSHNCTSILWNYIWSSFCLSPKFLFKL